ncbi:MAG: sulfatase-like hydrolase/transferase, partial [Thalassotalea sp.]|nr:sulfatase-like hydrolase/transferase [Thalassotalea sp.]
RDLWKVYNNLAETDKQIGAILDVLEDDGLLDNTIVVFYSDHGGPMPKQKRLIYDSGLKVPLIIRFPNGQKAGTIEERLVSFVDFAPTTLAMAGVPIPDYMQGDNFLDTSDEREYIYAAADRFDGFTDTIRAVRDQCYKYIRNYRPNDPYYLPVAYREKIPSMRELLALNAAGKLNEAQSQWFRKTKDAYELFNVCNDPYELSNLAYIKNYQNKRNEMESALNNWLKDIGDDPSRTERQLIATLWGDASTQPKTKTPKLVIEDGKAVIASETPGAFIAFRYKRDKTSQNWQIYKEAQPIKPGLIEAVAHRPGYIESATTTLSVEEN